MENTYDWACRPRFSRGSGHVYVGDRERVAIFPQGAEMEDGKNGAERYWNGYAGEKIVYDLHV